MAKPSTLDAFSHLPPLAELIGGPFVALDAFFASILPAYLHINNDPALSGLLLLCFFCGSLCVVALALAWGQLRGSGLSASRNQALIVGLNDSGKTSLFTILRYGKLSATQSSMEENSGSFRLHDRWLCITDGEQQKSKTFNFIDIPGHDKLRFKLLDYLPKARGVIFLVDASTFQKKIRSAAELLADILGERSVAKDEIPIVVVCNKADGLLAVSKDRIRSSLELELDRIRATRTAGVDNQGTDGTADWEYIGLEGVPFSFDQLGNRIEFIELSLKDIAEREPERDGENKEFVNLLMFLANEL